jgi:hypothetical protein
MSMIIMGEPLASRRYARPQARASSDHKITPSGVAYGAKNATQGAGALSAIWWRMALLATSLRFLMCTMMLGHDAGGSKSGLQLNPISFSGRRRTETAKTPANWPFF